MQAGAPGRQVWGRTAGAPAAVGQVLELHGQDEVVKGAGGVGAAWLPRGSASWAEHGGPCGR